MSKIRLHGSSSGYTEIAPVAASGNNTLTLPNDGTIISKDANGAVGVTSITVGTGVTIGDGKITCNGSAITNLSATALPAGTILQVVQATKGDVFTTTSTSNVDVTGLSASITPISTSNKILVLVYLNALVTASTNRYGGRMQLVRDSTDIARGASSDNRVRCTTGISGDGATFSGNVGMNFLDTPSSTSSLTYKVQVAHSQGINIRINGSVNDDNSATYGQRNLSTLILMEVAG